MPSELQNLALNLKAKARQNKADINDIVNTLATTIQKIDSLLTVVEKVNDLEAENRVLGEQVTKLEAQVSEMADKMNEIEKNTKANRKSIDSAFQKSEFERAKLNVIISGVRLHAKAKNGHESFLQTAEVAQTIMDTLKLKSIVINPTRFRKAPVGKIPKMKFSFQSVSDKVQFFVQLAAIKPSTRNEFVKNLNSRDECPSYLMEKYNVAQKRGYDIRKTHAGTKVRIVIRRECVEVMKKGPMEEKFTIVEEITEDEC